MEKEQIQKKLILLKEKIERMRERGDSDLRGIINEINLILLM